MCKELNDEMFKLVSQLDTFINGAAGSKVHTTQGAIDTLSGLVAAIKNMPLVQVVVDISTLSIARSQAGSALLPFGSLVRITADPEPLYNGLYRVEDTGVLVKTDYMEVCNLVQPPALDKVFGSDDALTNPVVVFSRVVPEVENQMVFFILDINSTFVGMKPAEESVDYGAGFLRVVVPPTAKGDPTCTWTYTVQPEASQPTFVFKVRTIRDDETAGRRVQVYVEPLTELVDQAPFRLQYHTEARFQEVI